MIVDKRNDDGYWVEIHNSHARNEGPVTDFAEIIHWSVLLPTSFAVGWHVPTYDGLYHT